METGLWRVRWRQKRLGTLPGRNFRKPDHDNLAAREQSGSFLAIKGIPQRRIRLQAMQSERWKGLGGHWGLLPERPLEVCRYTMHFKIIKFTPVKLTMIGQETRLGSTTAQGRANTTQPGGRLYQGWWSLRAHPPPGQSGPGWQSTRANTLRTRTRCRFRRISLPASTSCRSVGIASRAPKSGTPVPTLTLFKKLSKNEKYRLFY